MSSDAMPAPGRGDDARALARLALVSHRRAGSPWPGRRPGAAPGYSREFAAYRPYGAGDDVRLLDWNVYARLRRPFVRLFHAEAELNVHILLDTSNSMRFGSPDKLTYARQIVAALGYVGVKGYDRVGLATFTDRLHEVLPPQRGTAQLRRISGVLEAVQPAGASAFNRVFKAYAARAILPGLLLIVSDFFAADGYEEGLLYLMAQGYEPVMIQVLAAEELSPQLDERVVLRDLEDETRPGLAVPRGVVEEYDRNLADFLRSLEAFCRRQRLVYSRVLTTLAFDGLVMRLLEAGVWQYR